MFPTALIVFRETLEAALFVGIAAAATRGLPGRARWLTAGVSAGALAALAFALAAGAISTWAEGAGQDLVNVGILSLALCMLVWHCVWVSTHGANMALEARQLGVAVQSGQRPPLALVVALALAVLREGAETVLFVLGFSTGAAPGANPGLWSGSLLGLIGGVGMGVLMYTGLARLSPKRLFAVTNVLIAVLAAAIASQLARTLAQAGWVDHGIEPLWDSSAFLAGDSALGTALHALMGYDARPSGLQLLAYAGVLVFIALATRHLRQR